MLMTDGRVAGTIVRGDRSPRKNFWSDFSRYFHGPNLRHSWSPRAARPTLSSDQEAPTRAVVLFWAVSWPGPGSSLPETVRDRQFPARHAHSSRDPAQYAALYGHGNV